MNAPDATLPGRFALPVRVYYEDTDAAGVVYYANYLRYLERGRTEWLRALGFDQTELAAERGIAFAVRGLQIDYLKPARLDDELVVVSHVSSLGRAQLVFEQRVERAAEALVTASVRVACIEVARMKAAPLPETLRARVEALI
jgi:acyl-CoA thioester hydrolase